MALQHRLEDRFSGQDPSSGADHDSKRSLEGFPPMMPCSRSSRRVGSCRPALIAKKSGALYAASSSSCGMPSGSCAWSSPNRMSSTSPKPASRRMPRLRVRVCSCGWMSACSICSSTSFKIHRVRTSRLLRALLEDWQQGDGRTCFFVGDPMQSIYLFRDAESRLFHQVREDGMEIGGGHLPMTALQLSTNFRSTPAIVHPLNEVFARVLGVDPEDDVQYAPSVSSQGIGEQRRRCHAPARTDLRKRYAVP